MGRLVSVLLVGLLTHVTACESEVGKLIREAESLPGDVSHDGLSVVELKSAPLHNGEGFAWPGRMLLLGDTLVVADRPWLEGAVHLLSLDSGTRLATLGRRGQGPGEFMGVPTPIRSPNSPPGRFWLFDLATRRVTAVDLATTGTEEPGTVEIVHLPLTAFVYNLAFLSDSLVVVQGYFEEGRVALWEWPDGEMRFLGRIPLEGTGIPAAALQEAFQGPLAVRPGGGDFAIGTERGTRLDLFSSQEGWTVTAEGPFSWEPDFTAEARRGQAFAREGFKSRSGYVSLSGTEKGIFALFSGRLALKYRREMDLAEFIHEYDWEGEFKGAYHLDRPVEDIMVDEENRRIFATVRNPEPALVVFTLPATGVRQE